MTISIEEALKLVGRYLGLPTSAVDKPRGQELIELVVELPLTEYKETPVSCWKIDLGEVPFPPWAKTTSQRMQWSVTLDATTGELIEVRLVSERINSDVVASPTGKLARDRLAAHGEKYTRLVSQPPHVSFVDALNRVEAAGFASPAEASIVEAVLVVHEWLDHPPRPVWAIVLNGLPPWPAQPPSGVTAAEVPVWQRNHLRHVVDATSGEVLFATTIPQPDNP